MSIKINILENGAGVEILAFDIVYGNELIKACKKIRNNKDSANIEYYIFDQSKCTEYAVSSSDIASIAAVDKKVSEINPNRIVAIIESESLEFSLTELWQSHVEKFGLKSKSFDNRIMAAHWIVANKEPSNTLLKS